MQAGNDATMTNKNKLLSVLSDAEQEALYGPPDFDDAQRLEYLALTETELALASSRPGLHAQVYCLLQIGYFKARSEGGNPTTARCGDLRRPCCRTLSHECRSSEGIRRSNRIRPAELSEVRPVCCHNGQVCIARSLG